MAGVRCSVDPQTSRHAPRPCHRAASASSWPSGLYRRQRGGNAMREPDALITTDGLAGAFGADDLRVFDCTTYLAPPPPGSDDPYLAVPGRDSFEAAHIPGADFLDLQGEFSDNATRLRFMMPPLAQ